MLLPMRSASLIVCASAGALATCSRSSRLRARLLPSDGLETSISQSTRSATSAPNSARICSGPRFVSSRRHAAGRRQSSPTCAARSGRFRPPRWDGRCRARQCVCAGDHGLVRCPCKFAVTDLRRHQGVIAGHGTPGQMARVGHPSEGPSPALESLHSRESSLSPPRPPPWYLWRSCRPWRCSHVQVLPSPVLLLDGINSLRLGEVRSNRQRHDSEGETVADACTANVEPEGDRPR